MVVQTYDDLTRAIADVLDFDGRPRPITQSLLSRRHLYFLGFGSVARPMAQRALDCGVLDVTLADPKRYAEKSIVSQCEPSEVGRLKVEVGRECMTARGARVTIHPADLYDVPDGAVHANTTLIVSADNRRADVGANRLAVRMRALLLKVNVEPMYGMVSVRAFDFRRPSPVCVECAFSAETYSRQTHPKSCDGTGERSTGSPRILSQAAAELGVLALTETLDESRSARWLSHELLFSLETGTATWSELTPNRSCRCDHGESWPAMQRLASGPESISLAELARSAGIVVGQATHARFCRQVALQNRCEHCHHEVYGPRWLAVLDAATGDCPICGNHLRAVPFYVHGELPLDALNGVLEQPLAAWGVAPAAVIELTGATGRQAFAVGSDRVRPGTVPFFAGTMRSMVARTGLSPSPCEGAAL
jgi:hypothetical protein